MEFEKAIQEAMAKLNISKKKAICELTVFICGFGTVDDFKDFMNYLIKNQKELFKIK